MALTVPVLLHDDGYGLSGRHELFKKKYPDVENAHGIPYAGLSNARPETLEIAKRIKREKEAMPFNVDKYQD
jgi:hypothetical protein